MSKNRTWSGRALLSLGTVLLVPFVLGACELSPVEEKASGDASNTDFTIVNKANESIYYCVGSIGCYSIPAGEEGGGGGNTGVQVHVYRSSDDKKLYDKRVQGCVRIVIKSNWSVSVSGC